MFKFLATKVLIVSMSLLSALTQASAQSRTVSFGVLTGVTSTYTWDDGINADQRYNTRYDVKLSPIGLEYGVDFKSFGFTAGAGLFNVGQNFNVVNVVGSHVGTRKINLNYLQVPLAFRFHLIDLSFLTTSFVAGISPAYLLKGKETISHKEATLYFPPVVYPVLPSDYIIQSDGVRVPRQNKYTIARGGDFNSFQLFTFIGLRTDWYFSETWKVSFDARASYGIRDNRSSDYLTKLKSFMNLYERPGTRRDIVGNFTLGIARYFEIEQKESINKVGGKKGLKRNTKKYPVHKPQKSKSKP